MRLCILSFLFIAIVNNIFGQSVTVDRSYIRFNDDIEFFKFSNNAGTINLRSNINTTPPTLYFSTSNGASYGYLGNPVPNALNTFELGSFNSFAIRTYQSNWSTKLFVKQSGEVGIGTENPTTKFEVNGFTKLGSDAPAIKVKKLTGTSSSSQGGTVSIPHGLTASKILNVSVILEYQTNFFVPTSYNYGTGFEFDWYSTNGNIIVLNSSSNSSQILSKPFKILITYEE